jgi:hypothetical protein
MSQNSIFPLSSNLVVIIGAQRSGTNMLRNVLCSLPGFGTWPCDEINPIWRHGNLSYASDEFTPGMARPEVQKYIRRRFDNITRRYRLRTVVEKTCANSLRVGFVARILPEAKFIFIRRNGLDSTASALKRWTAKVDLAYQLRKARFVPLSDLYYYAFRFFRNRLHRLWSKDKRLGFWGPKLNRMQEMLTRYSLEEVCALQWKRCVDRAMEDFSLISPNRVVEVGYEDFVTSPEIELKRILDFLGYRVEHRAVSKAVVDVFATSIGKGMATLGDEKIQRVFPHIIETHQRIGYA